MMGAFVFRLKLLPVSSERNDDEESRETGGFIILLGGR
jgi:hypothetical protein